MKKYISVFIAIVIAVGLVGCSKGMDFTKTKFRFSYQEESENLDILISGDWEEDGEDCAYSISFWDDSTFSNSCSCGNPVGDSDLVEYYIYDDSTKAIYLYGPDKKYVSKGKVETIDEDEITVKLFGESHTYKNVK